MIYIILGNFVNQLFYSLNALEHERINLYFKMPFAAVENVSTPEEKIDLFLKNRQRDFFSLILSRRKCEGLLFFLT